MENIEAKNLIYNDTPQIRLFSSDDFNWCLDKSTGISCCWGKTARETPQYDPCGPQEIVWNITNFNLEQYIKYFDFIANIKLKKDNIISDIEKHDENTINKICLSTFGSIILIVDETINIEEFKNFLNYIRKFNIEPKIQLNYSLNIEKNITKFFNIISNIIISTKNVFNYDIINNCIKILKDNNINVSLKVAINKTNKSDVYKLINNIDNNISIIFYFIEPYLSTRNYLDFQSKCLQKKLTNVCISQCAKRHYSKDVIGSIIIELPCSFCRYSIYLNNNEIYDCEKMQSKVGNIEEFDTIHNFWNSSIVYNKRKSLIDKNKC